MLEDTEISGSCAGAISMARAVAARMQGDEYQAYFFWIQACRLFERHSRVSRVGYELELAKAFDDVLNWYWQAIPDERGDLVDSDYFQLKFHVDHASAFTWTALTDPRFIGATSVSLLQRLYAAQRQFAPDGSGARFYIVTPWSVHPDDALSELVSNQGGELRLHVLFDGSGPRGTMGKIRAAWREHLGLADERELERVLRPLRLRANAGDLASLHDRLNDKLRLAGLAPVDALRQGHPYTDLIRLLLIRGKREFTRDDLQDICRREGLWCGSAVTQDEQPVRLGIRSFMRWAEYMEDQTDHMICLVRHFDNRHIRDPQLWRAAVFREVAAFLSEHVRQNRAHYLHLDTHTSIAFAAGYCLDPKSGADVAPVQRTISGTALWRPSPSSGTPDLPHWVHREIPCASGGADVALAIGVTHDVLPDVHLYVQRSLPTVGRILACTVEPGPSPTAIRDGTHAFRLAEGLATYVRQQRSNEERLGVLHIFAAAPNGLMFFLGRLGRSFGRCILYEYDFEMNDPGAYQPSFRLPATGRSIGMHEDMNKERV